MVVVLQWYGHATGFSRLAKAIFSGSRLKVQGEGDQHCNSLMQSFLFWLQHAKLHGVEQAAEVLTEMHSSHYQIITF